MQHTNAAELRLLVDTFTRVWGSGGQANLNLTTRDGQVWARLDLQLGAPPAPRPGAPRAGGGPRQPQGRDGGESTPKVTNNTTNFEEIETTATTNITSGATICQCGYDVTSSYCSWCASE